MLQTLKRIVMSVSLLSLLAVPLLAPATVYAEDTINNGLNCGVNFNVSGATTGTADCPTTDPTDPGQRLNDILKLIINIFSLVVGVVAVIMIIIGGLKYITSGGDSGNVTGAKNTILYAIIGLVVVALSQFIVRFILSRVAPQ
jgi:hypothetical protein